MVLPAGTISMSQVNTELGRSATASINLNEAAVRNLAGVPSGAISMDNLRGKSSYLDQQTIVAGGYDPDPNDPESGDALRGWISNGYGGSVTDGTLNIYGNVPSTQWSLYWTSGAIYNPSLSSGGYRLDVYQPPFPPGPVNSGWTTLTIVGPNGTTVLPRSSATYYNQGTGFASWAWARGYPVYSGNQAFGNIGATSVATWT